MTTQRGTLLLALVVLCSWFAVADLAAQAPRQRDPRGLEQAMQRYFETTLRNELDLDDAQADALFPILREQQALRREIRLERTKRTQALRRAWREGAGDDALARTLRDLDALEERSFLRQRAMQEKIDETLRPVQRVKFRFAAERIRDRVQERLRDVRDRRRRR